MNEETLLERANEKPFFGWGSWGRNHIFDPDDGRIISITDGIWIIFIGVYGWVGYIARFGLLVLPIIVFAIYRRSLGTSFATQGLVLILCNSLIDLIPNSALVNYVWLIAGGIAGHVLWKTVPDGKFASPKDTAAPVDAAPSIFVDAPGQASWLMQSGAGQISQRSRRKSRTQQT